jgi:NhaP-type Na+/H+ or K+/H+ antiporter
MEMFFICGIAVGFLIGYPLGLFIDKLDKRIKNGGR